jgi:tetratricopeptide (TPR) repeat protein
MLADNLAGVALAQSTFGQAEHAIATAEEAFRIAESVDNPWSMAQGKAIRGYALLELGRFSEALQSLHEGDAYATAAETGGAMLAARCALASTYGKLGMLERGLEHGQRALDGAQHYIPDWHLWPHAVLIRLHLARGDIAAAQRIADESQLESPERRLFKAFMPGVAAVILAEAELARAKKNYGRVIAVADDAFEYFSGSAPNYLPDLLLVRAQALWGMGEHEQAAATMAQAREYLKTTRRITWEVLAVSSEIEQARGNKSEAVKFREAARGEMQFVSEPLRDEARAAFLNLASVRPLWK